MNHSIRRGKRWWKKETQPRVVSAGDDPKHVVSSEVTFRLLFQGKLSMLTSNASSVLMGYI